MNSLHVRLKVGHVLNCPSMLMVANIENSVIIKHLNLPEIHDWSRIEMKD